VCPYNRTAASGLHPEFAPREGIGARPDLAGLLAMDEAGFDRLWGPTAAAWRGLEAVQRNALVALGNAQKPEAIGPAREALASPSALLREHAAWALGRLMRFDPAPVRESLSRRLAVETDEAVREALEQALSDGPVLKG
jgi:epoxyqueuosine reductase